MGIRPQSRLRTSTRAGLPSLARTRSSPRGSGWKLQPLGAAAWSVSWKRAIAASHIAIELLLDGALADDTKLVAGYTAALGSELVLDDPAQTIALARLCARLHDAGAPHWYGVLEEMVPLGALRQPTRRRDAQRASLLDHGLA